MAGYRPPMVLVVAGDAKQFEFWRRENNLSRQECHYVKDENDLRGFHLGPEDRVVFYGTYRDRRGIGPLHSAILDLIARSRIDLDTNDIIEYED